MSAEYDELVRKLADRTERNEVLWQPTAREGEFIVFFDRFSLSVSLRTSQNELDSLAFRIRDAVGKEIDRFWVEENNPRWTRALEMYVSARRRALRIDEALSSIVGELDTTFGEVGKSAALPPDDDEDIPF